MWGFFAFLILDTEEEDSCFLGDSNEPIISSEFLVFSKKPLKLFQGTLQLVGRSISPEQNSENHSNIFFSCLDNKKAI